MSSSWGPKLEKKLKALADGASKESIQTLATWITFNRKHATAFAQVLLAEIQAPAISKARRTLYWQLLHQVCLSQKEDDAKWDRALELRITLGESVVLPALEALKKSTSEDASTLVEEISTNMFQEWDKADAFGGPTLIGQIKRVLTSKTKAAKTTATTSASVEKATDDETKMAPPSTAAATAASTAATAAAKKSPQASSPSEEPAASRRASLSSVGSASKRRGSLSSVTSQQAIEYDFESKNIPFAPVEPKVFLEPCKAVATLQIARDVRNDTPVQIHGLMQRLPKDILEAAEKGVDVETLDKATIRDYSIRIPQALLETDLPEAIQTIETFQDIIRKQQAARKTILNLLIKSRCQMGSEDAARLFFQLEETSKALQKKRQLLGDALELEGMDSELNKSNLQEPLEELSSLSWYKGDGDAKRQKVE